MHAQMHTSTNCKHASDKMTCHNARTQLYQDCIYRTLMLQHSLAHCKQHRAMHGQSQTRQRYIIESHYIVNQVTSTESMAKIVL